MAETYNNKESDQLFEMANNYMRQGDIDGVVALLQKASEMGHTFATTNLGICYYYGDGVKKDIRKAKTLFQKSEKDKDSSAVYYLGLIAKDEGNNELAYAFLQRSAELGNSFAQHDLGELYISGNNFGVEQDFRRAIHWFAYAAQQGHQEASKKFQMLYYNGYETKKAPTGFWFEREKLEGRTITCDEPYKVLIEDSEYVVPGFQLK